MILVGGFRVHVIVFSRVEEVLLETKYYKVENYGNFLA